MFVFRQVQHQDLDSILELAQFLGSSGSLPLNKKALEAKIENSIRSFEKTSEKKSENIYIFVLEDSIRKLVLGTSLVFAKHGTQESPHTYLEVIHHQREDPSTGISIQHQILRFEFDTDGPSEIGGLILHPDYRGLPIGLGSQLTYSRFIYMGMYPERFESNVIAEMLPPFNPDGTNELWEAFGKRFTGLSYQEADHLSRTNKDFIKNLFPSEDIYTCLFSKKVQEMIGETGKATSSARRLLEKIGFRYLNTVDPFDGGPHLGAKLKEISLVKRLKKASVSREVLRDIGKRGFVGAMGKSGFISLMCQIKSTSESEIQLGPDTRHILELNECSMDSIYWVHFV